MSRAHYYPPPSGVAFDIEKQQPLLEFAERTVRMQFIRKVSGLLAAQLALTTLIGGAIVFSSSVKAFLLAAPAVPALALLGSLGIMLAFAFSDSARHNHPTNLILLALFTVCEGILVGMASAQYATSLVVLAFALTAAASAGIAAYASSTKTDFTTMGGFLWSMLLTLMIGSMVASLLHTSFMIMASAFGGAALFSLYLIYDIQMLMGSPHHAAKVSPDEYVFATVSIYLDIINLFMHILRILNEMQRE